ncbi:hypothetical protein FOXG_11868 [Fusarium oxysporum f. sp. lycopersici 4287]|uniref:Major facilitator superfamily (MFS) profile domain-containing protein n=2 Tax=Fusarium oxysporum TaxID=5507 RepID=A0A0J9WRB4_FUSO4|nr:hypothetical protein FOXG_11868 [Fusarium oxysporum f. sp. lycopersici 4287]EXK29564.1 hypothetical protein FOMG_14036 [Fusarium oxysporum f. sp. melonis 26406]KAJ9418924.1 hypothetical protein QL093DRAFT_2640902 [Fusarium oxysporum]KNB12237.1 hypothetical protein FOXG_11868 [Fusarium oxysporum f. sp. lycopersici 4287]
MAAVGDLGPEEAGRRHRPPSVHSVMRIPLQTKDKAMTRMLCEVGTTLKPSVQARLVNLWKRRATKWLRLIPIHCPLSRAPSGVGFLTASPSYPKSTTRMSTVTPRNGVSRPRSLWQRLLLLWFVAIHGFVIIVAIFFLLPETLTRKSEPAITQELMRMSTRDSTKVKSKEFTTALKYYLIEPLSVLLLLRFPPVFLTVLIAAIAFSSVYVLNIVIESGFAQPRTNFKQTTIGLTYMSTGMGYIVSSMVGGQWMDSIIAREARKTGRYDG